MQAITLASVPMPVKCLAGLAGSEYAKQRSAFLFNPPFETLLVSDRDSGLFGAHCGMPGGCLTVGTGVAFSWLDESQQLLRRGGFGFMLADQGGGAWIGLRFLQELVRLADRGLIDESHQSLIDRLAIGQSVNQWMDFANAAQPRQFASLAKTIVEAEGQVSLSADIISEGLMALIYLIQDFPKHLRLKIFLLLY